MIALTLSRADISRFCRTVDLRQRDEKVSLVKKPGAHISGDILNEYARVEDMEPEIVKYCDIYTEDISEHLGLNETHLPNAVAFPALLNPMFGNAKLIVDSGLMTGLQYERAKGRLIQRMVRIKDRKCPSTSQSAANEDDLDSEDDDV